MKKYICIGSLLFAALSCSDFLELSPKTEVLEEEYFQTESEIGKALAGAYNRLQAGYDDGSHNYITFCADILSRDMDAAGSSATDCEVLQVLDKKHLLSAITTPAGIWKNCYQGIYRANLVIEKINHLAAGEEDLERYKAEAYLLRDFYHYWLWQFYGNIIILETTIADPDKYYSKSQVASPDEVYTFLIKDLDDNVIGKLPMQVEAGNEGHLTDAAARALKARVVLFQNDKAKFAEAVTGLEAIINSGEYALEADFEKIWLREGQHGSESIFEIEFSQDHGTMMVQMLFPRDLSDPSNTLIPGWGFGTLHPTLASAYTEGDIRRDPTVFAVKDSLASGYTYTASYNNGEYFLKKYAPRNGYYGPERFYLENNLRIIRYSDVLLMAAELHLRNGNPSEAQTHFNQVWKRAYGSAAPTVSLEEIYTQRRLEFAGEGLYYWDLLRRYRDPEAKASAEGDIAKVWSAADIEWLVKTNGYIPIPDAEITKSNKLLKQNTGY